MGPISREITNHLNKVVDLVLPKKEKYLNEKMIYYIRMYTDLVRAEENLSDINFNRMLNYLRVVRNMAKTSSFKEEELYFKRIHDIVNEILKGKFSLRKQIKRCILGDAYCDPYSARTKMQLAQNICILRILKRD